MGFFSGLTSMLGGGSKSSGSSQSGFALLPSQIQDAYKLLGTEAQKYIGSAGTQAFTPLAQTADETRAINMLRQGTAPTEQSLASDIQMQMNPYNDFVINEINRQMTGEQSALNQALSSAGQLGSNRQLLGANDIDLSRANQIGGFLQGQYNTALQNALTTLPQARQTDIGNLFNIGQFQRGLAGETAQAPVTALKNIGQVVGILPQSGGSTSTQSSSSNQGIGSAIAGAGSLAKGIGSLASLFSDRRLKSNIAKVGEENGFNIYEFNYTGQPQRYRGVMAQEVLETRPDAVTYVDGYLAVNYSAIGLQMEAL